VVTSEALKKTCQADYQAMADDARREADAQEWTEALNQNGFAANELGVAAKAGPNSTPTFGDEIRKTRPTVIVSCQKVKSWPSRS
jgi:hypothetical protein